MNVHSGLFGILLIGLASPRVLCQEEQTPVRITGPAVIFFSVSQAERDSIARQEGFEIDDMLDDFNYYSGKVAVYLHDKKIPVHFTTSTVVLVNTGKAVVRPFYRRNNPDPVGMILTDGVREPRLVPGLGTDRDYIVEINEYFRIK